jgi:hypothetical protein
MFFVRLFVEFVLAVALVSVSAMEYMQIEYFRCAVLAVIAVAEFIALGYEIWDYDPTSRTDNNWFIWTVLVMFPVGLAAITVFAGWWWWLLLVVVVAAFVVCICFNVARDSYAGGDDNSDYSDDGYGEVSQASPTPKPDHSMTHAALAGVVVFVLFYLNELARVHYPYVP